MEEAKPEAMTSLLFTRTMFYGNLSAKNRAHEHGPRSLRAKKLEPAGQGMRSLQAERLGGGPAIGCR